MTWECNRCPQNLGGNNCWLVRIFADVYCMSGHIQFTRSQCPVFWGLWSLRRSDKYYSLQRWIWRLHRHSLREIWPGRRCLDSHPDTLWESPARRQHYGSLCQERFWDKWTQRQNGISLAKLQALQHATHVQISIYPMFHRTTHLSARRYTEKRELMKLGAKWLLNNQNMFSLNSSESHCKKKTWLIL